jgi:glycine/D-amino acid oxidase-like deaminating enzyme
MSDDFRDKSFWMTTREYEPGAPLAGTIEVDVAIVGGGFTGLSAAHHLKRAAPEMKVALLESQVIGFGASGRNGGFNMTLFGLTLSITALRFGKESAREAHRYMERAVDTTRDLIAELGIDCDYEHPGFLRVATSEQYRARILHEIEVADSLGLGGIEWIERDAVRERVASPLYLGAWWEPRCGLLNPAKLSWGWKDVITAQGVQVFEGTPVVEMVRVNGRVRLATPAGSVLAGKVVLATNAYSHLIPQLKRKQIPAWTHIVLTEPLAEERLAAIGWRGREGIEDARNLVHYYRLTADNRLLMGGRDVSIRPGSDMDGDLDERTFAGLERDVVQAFPSLDGVAFTHRWGGPVSVTLDMAPALGRLGDERVVFSLGCMGHGVSMTHLNGATVADLVLGRKTDLTEVFFVNRRTLPWPPEPVRTLAARAIRGYMRWEDRRFDPGQQPTRGGPG